MPFSSANLARVLSCLLLAASGGLSLNHPTNADAAETTVYQSGQDGYHTYRIPAIVAARNGDLLAFAEGRKNGPADHGNIDVVLKRSSDGGKTWSSLQLVADEWDDPSAEITYGNPVPIVDRLDPVHLGRIWLVLTRNNATVYMTHSDDNGQTWSPPENAGATAIKPGWKWYATGPCHGIQLERGPRTGRLIVPSDHRAAAEDSWGAHILYSDDHGATWQVGAVDTQSKESPIHPNENLAVELVNGQIYVNARDQHGSDRATRAVAYSSDGGTTYDQPFAAEPRITTPVVQNSLLRFSAVDQGDSRNLLLYVCPAHPSKRRDLSILISDDEAASWHPAVLIHAGPAAYSDLVKLDADRVGVLFEGGPKLYDQIVFATFSVGDLTHRITRPDKYVTRAEWGSQPDPIPESRKHTPKWITIHHAGVLWTNSREPAEFVRNMQSWGKKRPQIEKPPRDTYWPDLPYHFLVAPDGRIFEGRPVEYEPESNTKYELAGNIGVEMMGDFERQRPSPAQLRSVVDLTAWLMQEHHIGLENVRTHRDAAPAQTTCPGRDFYRYFEDGQFRRWVTSVAAGEEPNIDPGPPLTNPPGPTELISDTRPPAK